MDKRKKRKSRIAVLTGAGSVLDIASATRCVRGLYKEPDSVGEALRSDWNAVGTYFYTAIEKMAICKIWLETYGLNVQNPGDTCCAMGGVCEECVQKQKLSGGE